MSDFLRLAKAREQFDCADHYQPCGCDLCVMAEQDAELTELRAVLSALGAVKGPDGWTVPNPCPAEHIPGRFGGWLCQGEFGCNGEPRIPVSPSPRRSPIRRNPDE